MFNLIARRIDRIRVRVTLKSHRQRVNRWESSGSRDRRFESFLASQPSEHEMTPGDRPTGGLSLPCTTRRTTFRLRQPLPAAEDAIHPRRGSLEHRQAISADAPETLLGRPIYENPAMANGSAAKAVAVGDYKRYRVDRAPLRVEGSIHHKFNTDQIALRTIERVDGDLRDTDAIRYLVNAAV